MLLRENLLSNGAGYSPIPKKEIEKLYILPSFEKTLNNSSFKTPIEVVAEENGIDTPTDCNSIGAVEHQERINHYRQLAEIDYAKDPFHIWMHKGVKYIIDGRFDEYRHAVDNNFDIYTIEHHFDSISQAKAFMMFYLLEKPQYNAPQRCLMALQLKAYFAKKAAKNKGRRTDLTDGSTSKFKKINTAKKLSKIANVGEQYSKQFNRILTKGKEIFDSEDYNKYISEILRETKSVNAIHRKLNEAIDAKEKRESFANENQDELLTPDETINTDSPNESEEEEIEESPEEIVYINPNYEEDFHNKIVWDDNIVALRKIPDNSVNLCFGSPPYNVPNVNYDVNVALLSHDEHIRKIAEVAQECYRIARLGGRLVLNVSTTFRLKGDKDEIFDTFIVHNLLSAFKEMNIGWKPRNVVVWNKCHAFKKSPCGKASAENPYFIANHEYLIVFSKGDFKATPEIPNAPSDLTGDEYYNWGQSVWDIVPQSKAKGNHPCPFPETLAERVIKMFSFVGDTVVEPWLGTGTSTAVAARWGRRWFGCDISPKYCLQSAERTAKAHKQFIDEAKENKEISNIAA